MYIQMLGIFSWTYSVWLGRNKSAFTAFLHDIRFLKKIPTTRSGDLSPSRSGIYDVTSVPCVQYGVTARTIDKIQPVCVKVLPYSIFVWCSKFVLIRARAKDIRASLVYSIYLLYIPNATSWCKINNVKLRFVSNAMIRARHANPVRSATRRAIPKCPFKIRIAGVRQRENYIQHESMYVYTHTFRALPVVRAETVITHSRTVGCLACRQKVGKRRVSFLRRRARNQVVKVT